MQYNIYKYDTSMGLFELFLGYYDENNLCDPKKVFIEIREKNPTKKDISNFNNGFFVISAKGEDNDISFYTIRTDSNGDIEVFLEIAPNTVDKDMLIDAIAGCNPTTKFIETCKDRIISKCITQKNGDLIWTGDLKVRLQKVSVIRLKEVYEKLKS